MKRLRLETVIFAGTLYTPLCLKNHEKSIKHPLLRPSNCWPHAIASLPFDNPSPIFPPSTACTFQGCELQVERRLLPKHPVQWPRAPQAQWWYAGPSDNLTLEYPWQVWLNASTASTLDHLGDTMHDPDTSVGSAHFRMSRSCCHWLWCSFAASCQTNSTQLHEIFYDSSLLAGLDHVSSLRVGSRLKVLKHWDPGFFTSLVTILRITLHYSLRRLETTWDNAASCWGSVKLS